MGGRISECEGGACTLVARQESVYLSMRLVCGFNLDRQNCLCARAAAFYFYNKFGII